MLDLSLKPHSNMMDVIVTGKLALKKMINAKIGEVFFLEIQNTPCICFFYFKSTI